MYVWGILFEYKLIREDRILAKMTDFAVYLYDEVQKWIVFSHGPEWEDKNIKRDP